MIRILDSAAYTASELTLPRGVELTLEAAPGERPTLRANNDEVALRLQASGNARVVLSGLLVGGSLRVTGELDLELFDVTLWQATPRPALRWVSDGRSEPHLALTRCVTGPLCVSQAVTTHISESVVDGRGGLAFAGPDGGSGPRLRLDAVTALGDVRTRALEHAEDVLVRGVVRAETASLEIVMNADFVLELTTPYGEAKTRLVGARAAAVPAAPFVSERFGDPGYALLRLDAGDTVLRGGSGGAELGAYRALASGQRLANLTPALAEYLPWGVKAGIFVLGQRPSCGSGCHSPRRSKTSSRDLEP